MSKTTKREREILFIVNEANSEYWRKNRENELEYDKGNKRPHQVGSLPDLIAKRVNEYLDSKEIK